MAYPDASPTRVAVIGTGSIGMRHLGILQGLANVVPVAVPKRQERLSQLADAGYEVASSLSEAVDKGVTLGVIASDTSKHVDDGSAAMKHGLDILVEKPMSVDSPGEGGVLLDLIHEVDYAGWIFGWPETVQARLVNAGRLGISTEEIAELSWEMPGGGILSISLDYLSKPTRRGMRASGEDGTVEWDGVAGTTTLQVNDSPAKSIQPAQDRNDMYVEQDQAFIKATEGLTDPRLATSGDGIKALAVCDAARNSPESKGEARVVYL